ncbi:MAG: polysaccharide deacetylase family protein [Pyrinomonadaceae bacterium]
MLKDEVTNSSSQKSSKPTASLSLDLDNQWSYMKTHGDKGWESFPSYLDLLVPRVLSFLKERALTITFFIVGQDAALEKNTEALAQLTAAGHEVGNHSFHHEPWLHLYSEQEVEDELKRAEEQIECATGYRTRGFRGPGYSLSDAVLKVLAHRGYKYDCSTLPTFIGPLSRAYYFMTSKLTEEEKQQRKILFGTVRDGLRPVKPFRWQLDDGASLVEIPVTTMPIFKVPIHVSYLLYLSAISSHLALNYFRFTLKLCRLTGTGPSLLLHPLDFLGRDDIEALSFFPGMKLTSEEKMATVSDVLRLFSASFNVVNVGRHADEIAMSDKLPVVESKRELTGKKFDAAKQERHA